MIMKYQEPTARLISCEVIDKVTMTKLKFDRLPSSPLAPSSFGNITAPTGTFIEFHKVVQREGMVVTFETYEAQVCLLLAGERYTFRCLWDRSQLKIAQSNPEQWSKNYFKASDMLAYKNQDGSTVGRKMTEGEAIDGGFVIHKGWEHEHCSLCWKTISELEPDEHFGYLYNSDWVCQECYTKYIESGFGKKLGDLD
jgi:hypothetical protein